MDVCVFMREVESCVRQLGVEEEEAALREAAPTDYCLLIIIELSNTAPRASRPG